MKLFWCICFLFSGRVLGQDVVCTHVADIVLVSDHSGSISGGEFDDLQDYLVTLVKGLDVGQDKVHVGSVWFGTTAGVDFSLTQYSKGRDTTNAIRAIVQRGGMTNIEAGIETAANIAGLRAYTNVDPIERTMIVITDGAENAGSDARSAAARARLDHWQIIAIGVGNGVDKNLVNEISRGAAYYVDNFQALTTLVDIIDGLECVLQCDAPPILNSNAFVCDNTEGGHSCEFACDVGYKVSTRNPIAYCGDDGEWESLPTCNLVPTCPPPGIEFSNADEKCAGKLAGETCFFECYEDYETDIPVIQCDDNGNWLSKPVCEPQLVDGEKTPDPEGLSSEELEKAMNTALFTEVRKVMGEIMFGSNGYDLNDVQVLNEFAIFDAYGWGIPKQYDDLTVVTDPDVTDPSDPDTEVVCEDHPDFVGAPDGPDACGCPCFAYCQGQTAADYCDEDYDPVLGLYAYEACPVCCLVCQPGLKLLQADEITPFHKINVLDRQPFNDDASVYDAYKTLLYDALIEEDTDEVKRQEYDDNIDILLTEIEEINDIFYDDADAPYTTLEEFYDSTLYGRIVMQKEDEVDFWLRKKDRLLGSVARLANKLDDDWTLTENGEYPNWYATPTPEELFRTFQTTRSSSAKYEYEIDRLVTQQKDVIAENTAFYAGYKGGQFRTVSYRQDAIHTKVSLTFKKWARVYVRPGAWYDSSWPNIAALPGKMEPGWCLEGCAPGEGSNIWGEENPLLNSVITQMIVASDIEIRATMNASMLYELGTIYEEADGIRFGNFCTGKACVTSVNVILGLDGAPTIADRSYIKFLVTYLLGSTFREASDAKTIAVLGSSRDLNASPGNAGGAIQEVISALGLDASFYSGADEIEQFFEDLDNGDTSPQIIWMGGTEASNSLGANEGAALESNHRIIQEYATDGGGILAHGTGDIAYGWLKQLLPDLTISQGCDRSDVHITAAGSDWLPAEITTELLENIPCYGHFGLQGLGNLDPLVSDLHDEFYILGAHGGLTENSNPFLSKESSGYVNFYADDWTGNYEVYARIEEDVPQILAKYAPRFP